MSVRAHGEGIVTYDAYGKVLFSTGVFGKFGPVDVEEDWACAVRLSA